MSSVVKKLTSYGVRAGVLLCLPNDDGGASASLVCFAVFDANF